MAVVQSSFNRRSIVVQSSYSFVSLTLCRALLTQAEQADDLASQNSEDFLRDVLKDVLRDIWTDSDRCEKMYMT